MSTSTFAQTSAQPAIEWLVFDLGGVLVDVAPGEEICAELSQRTATEPAMIAGLLRERFVETSFSPAERFQIGELDITELADALNASLQRLLSPAALEQSLLEVLRGEKADTTALLAEDLATLGIQTRRTG